MKIKFKNWGFKKVINIDDIQEEENEMKYERNNNTIKHKICAVTPYLCTIAYVLMGSLGKLWHPGWLVFLLIPIVPVILYLHKKTLVVDIINLIIFFSYFVIGFIFDIWHPTWVVFLLIPVIEILFGSDK